MDDNILNNKDIDKIIREPLRSRRQNKVNTTEEVTKTSVEGVIEKPKSIQEGIIEKPKSIQERIREIDDKRISKEQEKVEYIDKLEVEFIDFIIPELDLERIRTYILSVYEQRDVLSETLFTTYYPGFSGNPLGFKDFLNKEGLDKFKKLLTFSYTLLLRPKVGQSIIDSLNDRFLSEGISFEIESYNKEGNPEMNVNYTVSLNNETVKSV